MIQDPRSSARDCGHLLALSLTASIPGLVFFNVLSNVQVTPAMACGSLSQLLPRGYLSSLSKLHFNIQPDSLFVSLWVQYYTHTHLLRHGGPKPVAGTPSNWQKEKSEDR